ncbi:hypothetical protein [Diaphorobacter ruginosibacter]|uniref:hypothetical protein n=1 Tax=Diaphorobacter ruginosibacter TaxID=1715720 RepID=UPI0033429539
MKIPFLRPARMQRTHAPAMHAGAAAAARQTDGAAHSPLEQLRELDTQTCWPTHRIRNFLATQGRGAR